MSKALSAIEVKRISKPGLHMVGGVPGLALKVTKTGSRSWILRTTIGGKRRDIGLGSYPGTTLAAAREEARAIRDRARAGHDPLQERRQAVAALASAMTFRQAAKAYIEAHKESWTNEKHLYQWRATLEEACTVLGDLNVKDIETRHIVQTLEPMWQSRTETASRLRGRIERVLDWSTVRGYREGTNPARWKGHLEHIFPSPGKIAKVRHFSSLPYDRTHDFIQALRLRLGVSAKALEFVIFTSARSGEVRGATWEEIDLDKALWTIPAHRMKMEQEHVQPLNKSAIALLEAMAPPEERQGLIFETKRGNMLSDMAMAMLIRRMDAKKPSKWVDPVQDDLVVVPHGFRSTFRTWGAEQTAYPREVIEMCLAHDVRGQVERAYQRSDHLDARRRLLEDWSQYVERGQVEKVVQLVAR